MNIKEIRKKVKSLGKFYYYYDFDGVKTRDKNIGHRGVDNWRRRLSDILSPLIREFSDPVVFDVGCNMGILSYEMSKLGARVIGVENDKRYFDQAKFLEWYVQKHLNQKWNVELKFFDMLRDEFYSKEVDIVTFFAVIYWLEPNENEVIRKIKKFFPNHKYIVLQGNITSAHKNLVPGLKTRRLATHQGMVKFLKDHGYSIIGEYEWDKYPKPVVVGQRKG